MSFGLKLCEECVLLFSQAPEDLGGRRWRRGKHKDGRWGGASKVLARLEQADDGATT